MHTQDIQAPTPRETVAWPDLLERLAEPFPAELVSWRAGSTSRDKKRAQALPYAEPRAYEDRLNAVCPGDWSVLFRPWGESKLICELTLYGVTRSSTGEYEENAKGAVAQGTAAEAQAFKRACSKFGLGRYLYDVPLTWVEYDEEKRRLVETPQLPARFLPNAAGAARSARAAPVPSTPVPSTPVPSTRTVPAPSPAAAPLGAPAGESGAALDGASPRLSPERSEAMSRELEKLGFNRREQLRLAASSLGRNVSALGSLSEAEALEVWAAAKRVGSKAA